jgi:hypothetical protein
MMGGGDMAMGRDADRFDFPQWVCWLPNATWRDRMLLLRIYSCQVHGGCYRRSLAELGREVNVDRTHVKEGLVKLCRHGYLVKRANGAREPASYGVDVDACVVAARSNGWEPERCDEGES